MTVRILRGDCRAMLKTLPADSVHCCVTSPPYWGLRSYLPDGHPDKHLEIGSEPTVQEWVQTMVEVFREVRRVLRPDGTLWLNLGDSYAGSRPAGAGYTDSARRDNHPIPRSDVSVPGLKPKDLVGQPWRVAFALQADGWWLRQELIWAKKNPMPESCRDRFTKAHEQVFLLSKSATYYFDEASIQEPASENTHDRTRKDRARNDHKSHPDAMRNGLRPRKLADASPKYQGEEEAHRTKQGLAASERKFKPRIKNNESFDEAMAVMPTTRNPRSVRWLASEPFKGAHYATYPPELIEPFIKAGCPEGGTVLDPFGGSGTTGLVADRLHRNAVLIDLDERNVPMAHGRITGDAPLFAEVV